MTLWWLSFVDPTLPDGMKWLGACMVDIYEGSDITVAVKRAHALQCNPGGEVQGYRMPDEDAAKVTPREIGRLMTRQQCNAMAYRFRDRLHATRNERRIAYGKELMKTVDFQTYDGDQAIILAWEKLVRDEAIAAGDIDPTYAFTAEDHGLMEAERIGSLMAAAFDHLSDAQKQELAGLTRRQALKMMNGKGLPEIVDGFVRDLVDAELRAREGELRTRIVGEINARWEQAVEAVVEDRVQKAIAKIKAEIGR